MVLCGFPPLLLHLGSFVVVAVVFLLLVLRLFFVVPSVPTLRPVPAVGGGGASRTFRPSVPTVPAVGGEAASRPSSPLSGTRPGSAEQKCCKGLDILLLLVLIASPASSGCSLWSRPAPPDQQKKGDPKQ